MTSFSLGFLCGLGVAVVASWVGTIIAKRKFAREAEQRMNDDAARFGVDRYNGETPQDFYARVHAKRIEDTAKKMVDEVFANLGQDANGPTMAAVTLWLRDGAPIGSA